MNYFVCDVGVHFGMYTSVQCTKGMLDTYAAAS